MTYYVESRWGGSEVEPSEERMRELLAELDENDPEHPDTWLTHESGWSLAVFETGLVVWEHLELPDPPRHLINVTKEKALVLWLQLARGNLVEIESEAWQDGYGPPLTEEERVERAREVANSVMESDRKFYQILGPASVQPSQWARRST